MKIHQREIRTQAKRTKDQAKTLQNPKQVVAPLVIRKSEQNKQEQKNPMGQDLPRRKSEQASKQKVHSVARANQ
jgi:hypothetical protein